MQQPQLVISAYRPKAGQAEALLALVRRHYPTLRAEGLVTERPAYVGRAADGTVVEVFEWTSPSAADEAHRNAAVGEIWGAMDAAAEFVPLAQLPEAARPFSNFAALT